MNRLLQIELNKIRTYRTFWILTGLYLVILLGVFLSGKLFTDFLISKGGDQFNGIDLKNIPFYAFPDVWQNMTYVAGFLKFIMAIYVIISITNEINYNTLRQNIIDGMSRSDFLVSKLMLIFVLSLISTVFLLLCGLSFGFLFSQKSQLHYIFQYTQFLPGHFLQLSTYLIFALFIGLLIKRSGLAMGLLFLYTLIIEPLITFRIKIEWIKGLFPLKAINNLIRFPFKKYALREIQDYIAWHDLYNSGIVGNSVNVVDLPAFKKERSVNEC